jgi:hypothetical protein
LAIVILSKKSVPHLCSYLQMENKDLVNSAVLFPWIAI